MQKDKATMKKYRNLDWSTFYLKKSYFYFKILQINLSIIFFFWKINFFDYFTIR